MATLHIRGVPDELYERVRQLAQMRRRSLTDEIVYLLEQALEDEALRQEQSDLLDSIGQQCYTPPPGMDSLTMLREGRASATIALLESWLSGDADEQRETGTFLIEALDEDRRSSRPLFPPEAKGETW